MSLTLLTKTLDMQIASLQLILSTTVTVNDDNVITVTIKYRDHTVIVSLKNCGGNQVEIIPECRIWDDVYSMITVERYHLNRNERHAVIERLNDHGYQMI